MPILFAGVDPGLAGAMALLSHEARIHALGPTPVLEAKRGQLYDLGAIARTLHKWARFAERDGGRLVLVVEKLRALPATRRDERGELVQLGGWQTNLHRGEARGWWWLVAGLAACGLPVHVHAVEPQEWQRAMVKGLAPNLTHKERSILAARGLFPAADLRRSRRHRVDDHGIAEALLLAEYGRRLVYGGNLFAAAERGPGPNALTPIPRAAHTPKP